MNFHRYFLVFGLVLFAGCDVQQENPLSSPSEYFEQGVAYYREGSYRQAKGNFEQALKSISQNELRINVAELYGYLGRSNFELGQYRLALDNLELASRLSSQMYDYRLQAQVNEWEGNIHLEMRDYASAEEWYRKSMRLSSALNDFKARAHTELLTAHTLIDAAKYEAASTSLNEALAALQNGGDKADVAEALGELGEINRRMAKYPEALNSITQAMELASSEEPLVQARLRIRLGLVFREQGNANEAIAAFRNAVNILRPRKVDKRYEALALFYLGTVYDRNGRLGDAKKFYSDALDIDRSIGDKIAEDYLYLFVIRCNLALMAEDQRERASAELAKSYQQIATRFSECGHRSGEAYTYVLLGSVDESQGDLSGARAMYQKAIEIDLGIEGEYYSEDLHLPFLVELGIADDRPGWYDKLAEVLLKLNQRYEAVSVLDLSRLKCSSNKFRDLDIAVRHPQLKDLVKDCRAKLGTITILDFELSNMLSGKQKYVDYQQAAALRAQLESLRRDLKEKTDRITAIQPNYETLLHCVQKKSQELQQAIPEGTVVLQFLPADENLSIFAMSKTSLDVQRVSIGRDSLISMVHEYQQLLQDPAVYAGVGGEASIGAMTRFEKLSTQLYDIFIRPVDSRFLQNLVIVVRDEFRDFPFHALERQDIRGNVKYLIELTGVDYLNSLSSLRYKLLSTSGIRSIVAFGNPSGKNWSVDYELHDVRSFYKGASIMLGAEASLKNILASRGDVLQLSTDFANTLGESDLGTFVCSTGKTLGETETVGFERLTDHEPYPVVELSNQYGQGVGLSSFHALLLRMNGTSDVFLNAWTADRKAAKFFSESFYTNLAAGLAPGDAYRQALLNLIATREVSHPRSWGQFFHFGVG